MTARAALTIARSVDHGARVVSKIQRLRSEASLVLRPTRPKEPEPLVRGSNAVARVSLVAGTAGPLGGDDFELNVCVGAGSTLLLNEISATLLLPGARAGQSRMCINVKVEAGASFVWMAEPVIAAGGCDHLHEINIDLAPTARMLIRDELQFGRHKELPGNVQQDLRVKRNGQLLFCQQLRIGPAMPGWRSSAVTGRRKCVGNVLVVDPQWEKSTLPTDLFAPDAIRMALEGPAVLISALAADTYTLRKRLDQGIQRLGDPWAPVAPPSLPDKQHGGGQVARAAPV